MSKKIPSVKWFRWHYQRMRDGQCKIAKFGRGRNARIMGLTRHEMSLDVQPWDTLSRGIIRFGATP